MLQAEGDSAAPAAQPVHTAPQAAKPTVTASVTGDPDKDKAIKKLKKVS